MTDPELLRSLALPWAARLQGDVLELDLELAERARFRHPGVRWWWGQRITAGSNGARCYVCGATPATWYRARPITRAAVAAILEHRSLHGRSTADVLGTDTAGTSPAGDVPPSGGQE